MKQIQNNICTVYLSETAELGRSVDSFNTKKTNIRPEWQGEEDQSGFGHLKLLFTEMTGNISYFFFPVIHWNGYVADTVIQRNTVFLKQMRHSW